MRVSRPRFFPSGARALVRLMYLALLCAMAFCLVIYRSNSTNSVEPLPYMEEPTTAKIESVAFQAENVGKPLIENELADVEKLKEKLLEELLVSTDAPATAAPVEKSTTTIDHDKPTQEVSQPKPTQEASQPKPVTVVDLVKQGRRDEVYGRVTIATAASSNHFCVTINQLLSIRRHEPEARVVVYDLGLTPAQRWFLAQATAVEYRVLSKGKYPKHVYELGGYAWKAAIVAELLPETDMLVWTDGGNNIIARLDQALKTAKEHGVYIAGYSSMTKWVHQKMFDYFKAKKESFESYNQCMASFMVFDQAGSAELIVKPWLSCALVQSCITPSGTHRGNHQQDQSAITFVIHNHTLHNVGSFKCGDQYRWLFTTHNDAKFNGKLCPYQAAFGFSIPQRLEGFVAYRLRAYEDVDGIFTDTGFKRNGTEIVASNIDLQANNYPLQVEDVLLYALQLIVTPPETGMNVLQIGVSKTTEFCALLQMLGRDSTLYTLDSVRVNGSACGIKEHEPKLKSLSGDLDDKKLWTELYSSAAELIARTAFFSFVFISNHLPLDDQIKAVKHVIDLKLQSKDATSSWLLAWHIAPDIQHQDILAKVDSVMDAKAQLLKYSSFMNIKIGLTSLHLYTNSPQLRLVLGAKDLHLDLPKEQEPPL